MWEVAQEVRDVHVERDMAKAEVESVHAKLVGARQAVGFEEPNVWLFDTPASLDVDILMLR